MINYCHDNDSSYGTYILIRFRRRIDYFLDVFYAGYQSRCYYLSTKGVGWEKIDSKVTGN